MVIRKEIIKVLPAVVGAATLVRSLKIREILCFFIDFSEKVHYSV